MITELIIPVLDSEAPVKSDNSTKPEITFPVSTKPEFNSSFHKFSNQSAKFSFTNSIQTKLLYINLEFF